MKITAQELPEVLLLEPRVFSDDRGFFMETFSTRSFPGQAPPVRFVQDNVSFSSKGTLRGLHLQHPHQQGKLVMAITGAIWDVAVDVRRGSPTFGKWTAAELTAENKHQLYVPPGFAHGFCVLSETAYVHYKCTDLYEPSCELGLRFDDPDLAIPWPVKEPQLSDKDARALRLEDIDEARLPQYEAQPAAKRDE
jgi:dTDP-4-dehydrorhamnose 3,5-epimerase